jgi:hypothetical protein
MKNTTNKKCKTCPFCGANLDYGERCDCRDETAKAAALLDDLDTDESDEPPPWSLEEFKALFLGETQE